MDQNTQLNGTQNDNAGIKNNIPTSLGEEKLADTRLSSYSTPIDQTPAINYDKNPLPDTSSPAPVAETIASNAEPPPSPVSPVPEINPPEISPEIAVDNPEPANTTVEMKPVSETIFPIQEQSNPETSNPIPIPIPTSPDLSVNADNEMSAPIEQPISTESEPQNNLEKTEGQIVDGVRPEVPQSNPVPLTIPNSQPNIVDQPTANISESQADAATAIPKKGKGSLIVIILVVIIFGIAGVIYATEAGYFNSGLDKYWSKIGLQKIWGGLPNDGKLALGESALKMKDLASVKIDSGELSLEITQDANLPLNVYLPTEGQKIALLTARGKVLGLSTVKAADTESAPSLDTPTLDEPSADGSDSQLPTAPTQTYRITAKIDGSFGKQVSSATLKFDSSSLADNLAVFGITNLASNLLSIEIKTVNNKIYLKIPALGIASGSANNKWYEFDLADYKSVSPVANLTKDIGKAGEVVKSGEKISTERIDGVLTNKYLLKLDAGKLVEMISGTSNSGLSSENTTLEVWIGKRDHYIHKLNLTSVGSFQGIQTTVGFKANLSDYNKSLTVTPPEESQIEKNGLQALADDVLGNGTGLETSTLTTDAGIKTRDVMRKSDLRLIKNALESYYDDNSGYPISAVVSKSTDTNGVLNKFLVPKYIQVLPADPTTANYYGYKSEDGKHFELTAVLENTSDSEGKNEGSYHLYKITDQTEPTAQSGSGSGTSSSAGSSLSDPLSDGLNN